MSETAPQILSLTPEAALARLVADAEELAAAAGRRVIIGIAGGPGVGKSTLATGLVEALNRADPGLAAYVPMDGFHMLHAKLAALGRAKDKGMPHTFEGEAFAQFLDTLRSTTADISGPGYSREIEDVVPDAFVIPAKARVLVTEGNYLLLANSPWWRIRPLLDLAAFIDVPRDKVKARLLKRHAEHGLFTEEHIRDHVERVDLGNYDLVQGSRGRADIVIDLITDA